MAVRSTPCSVRPTCCAGASPTRRSGCHLAERRRAGARQHSIPPHGGVYRPAAFPSAAWERPGSTRRSAARDAHRSGISAPAHARPLSGGPDATGAAARPRRVVFRHRRRTHRSSARCCQCCASCRMRCCWPWRMDEVACGESCAALEHRLLIPAWRISSAYPARLRAVPARSPGGCAAELGTAAPAAPDGLTLPFTEHAALLGPLLRSPETAAARSRVAVSARGAGDRAALAAARRTNAEIAEALHLSEATVKNHLKRIFDKFLGLDGARGKRMLLADVAKISPLRGL